MTALRVLCLDIEGGYGGSSRSLYYSLKSMDRAEVVPTVWCKKAGPIQKLYAAAGIAASVEPLLPKASALPRTSRNLVQLAAHLRDFWAATPACLARLAEAARAHDLVHCNHEGFALLALWLRKRAGVPVTVHVRTNVQPGWFARQQMRAISAAAAGVVFITPNEERTFRSLGGTAPGRVILNPVDRPVDVLPHPGIPDDGRLKLACVANAAVVRGTDRLIEIARALTEAGRRDVLIVVAGDMALKGEWPGACGAVARAGGTLVNAARQAGLSDWFCFLGHVDVPEQVLAACHALLKPTREANPWGRDIIEAMAAGLPVLSVGEDSTFVETGVTGVLQPRFDPSALALDIAGWADARDVPARLGRNAAERALRLCDATERARDLAAFWRDALARG